MAVTPSSPRRGHRSSTCAARLLPAPAAVGLARPRAGAQQLEAGVAGEVHLVLHQVLGAELASASGGLQGGTGHCGSCGEGIRNGGATSCSPRSRRFLLPSQPTRALWLHPQRCPHHCPCFGPRHPKPRLGAEPSETPARRGTHRLLAPGQPCSGWRAGRSAGSSSGAGPRRSASPAPSAAAASAARRPGAAACPGSSAGAAAAQWGAWHPAAPAPAPPPVWLPTVPFFARFVTALGSFAGGGGNP